MLALKTVLMFLNMYAMIPAKTSLKISAVQVNDLEIFSNNSKVLDEDSIARIKNSNQIKESGKRGDLMDDTNYEELSDVREGSRKRIAVKLNKIQTLIMNEAISVYALTNSTDHVCRNHSKEFRDGLRAFEPWALQMLDSSSKLQAGILSGNFMDFGSFRQCVDVSFESQYGLITGKHCVIKIQPSEKAFMKLLSYKDISKRRYRKAKKIVDGANFSWTVCIPESCSSGDALKHINKSMMSVIEGFEVKISLSDIDCYSNKEEMPLTKSEKIIIYGFFGYFMVIIVCTILDLWYRRKNVSRSKSVDIFSIYSNVAYLTSNKEESANLECLHGIRFITICWVVVIHKYMLTLLFPSVNSLEILDWFSTYSSSLVNGGTVSVDTFFLMSGLLVSYHFFDHMSKGGKFNYITFCIHRYIRLTPSLGAFILIVVTLTHRFGSGPLWKNVCSVFQGQCQNFWWSSLVYIQPYVNPKFVCLVQSWHLSSDMQFYLLSPLIMYPLWKWRVFGIVNLIVLYICSVCINFYVAWKNKFEADLFMNVQVLSSDVVVLHYYIPYIRASPYILAIGFGYILHMTKDMKIKMGKITLIFGWLSCVSLLATIILYHNRFELEEYEYNRLEQSLFLSMHRSAWVIGLMWIIWACRTGYGGPINTFLSLHVFKVLGKLTYSIFLIHMPIQYLTFATLKMPLHFSNFDCVHGVVGDFCLSLILGFLLTILVEYPFSRFFLHNLKNWRVPAAPKEKSI